MIVWVVRVHLVGTVVSGCLVRAAGRVGLVSVVVHTCLVRVTVRIHLIRVMITIRLVRVRHACLNTHRNAFYTIRFVENKKA